MATSTASNGLPRIAIVGAGPSGLVLARLLSQQDIPVTIFEMSPNMRTQGGTLDLHDESGRAAIVAAGLDEAYLKHARTDGDGMRICDKHGRLWLRLPGSTEGTLYSKALAQGKPEIDRGLLQNILTNSLPTGCIQYNRKIKSFDASEKKIYFADGTVADGFDMVVGADGAFSKVRNSLTDVRPYHSGVGGFGFTIREPAKQIPKIYDMVNRGGWFNYSEERLLIAQQMGDDTLSCVAFGVVPEDWQESSGYDVKDGKACREALHDLYAAWSSDAHDLISALDPSSVWTRNLYMLPVDFEWDHVPGVTLIGDAVHLMLPFIGEGVNCAMQDSLELAQAIIAAGTDRTKLYANQLEYEQKLFPRDHEIKRRCKDMAWYMLYARGAPGTSIHKWVARSMSDEVHPFVASFVRNALGAIYFVYRTFFVR